MAGIRIHLPGALDPERAGSNLSKTLRRKVSEGITRKVERNINGLRQLNVTPFDASLKLGTEFREIKFREIEFREVGWMDFEKPFGKQFKVRQLKVKAFDAELRFGDLDLNAELDFNR